jgi:hypothetical protein
MRKKKLHRLQSAAKMKPLDRLILALLIAAVANVGLIILLQIF